MILDYLMKRFRFSTWSFLIIGVLVVLFILWLFFSNRDTSSSSNTFQEAINRMFQPVEQTTTRSTPAVPSVSGPFTSRGEIRCREIMEKLTGEKFEKVRPSWLTNPVTQQKLELDCYCEKLKLAVEYNGEQHYKYNSYMHQNSRDRFYNQQYRDLIKKDLCDKNHVRLIVVPYDIPLSKIESYLIQKLSELL